LEALADVIGNKSMLTELDYLPFELACSAASHAVDLSMLPNDLSMLRGMQ